MKTIKHLDDGTIIGDPFHIIRDKDAYDEFFAHEAENSSASRRMGTVRIPWRFRATL